MESLDGAGADYAPAPALGGVYGGGEDLDRVKARWNASFSSETQRETQRQTWQTCDAGAHVDETLQDTHAVDDARDANTPANEAETKTGLGRVWSAAST